MEIASLFSLIQNVTSSLYAVSLKIRDIKTKNLITAALNDVTFLYSKITELNEEKRSLIEQLNYIKNWDEKTAKQYIAVEIGSGNTVFVEKILLESKKTIIPLCPNCFVNRKKSALFFTYFGTDHSGIQCPDCGVKYSIISNKFTKLISKEYDDV